MGRGLAHSVPLESGAKAPRQVNPDVAARGLALMCSSGCLMPYTTATNATFYQLGYVPLRHWFVVSLLLSAIVLASSIQYVRHSIYCRMRVFDILYIVI